MINYHLKSDEAKHVCEMQLVHSSLLTARKGLPGHAIYNVVRNASEFIERLLGGLSAAERGEGVRRLREEMGEQTGPLRQRPACLTWVAWVEAAGARVRGTARAPVAVPAVRQLES